VNRRHFLLTGIGACAICTGRAGAAPRDPLPPSLLERDRLPTLANLAARLHRLRQLVGYARFNLVDLDQARKLARRYQRVGAFEADELALLEHFFHTDPAPWGFHGPRVSDDLAQRIDDSEVSKIRGSGHYLYRGAAERLFARLQCDIGEELLLTSGVRNHLKQAQLFCDRLLATDGDYAAATHWVAPPGHSYHASGDFDVGVAGLGGANFTDAFLDTDAARHIARLDYAVQRYPADNPWGVAHEPWHIQVS